MAISPELGKFKAPGVKLLTEVVEQTSVLSAPNGTRLLVGNFRKGPVNLPVFISTWNEFKQIFGDISEAEERSGGWGKRSAYYMLQVSPIYVLNLRAFDDTKDLAGTQELSMSSDVSNANVSNEPYSSLFNKQQFWKIDPKQLIKDENTDKLLIFGNVGDSNLSYFVRKSNNVRTSLSFEQWYKQLGRKMPDFVYPEDKVADWYVDIVIFENDFDVNAFTNASYGHLFNTDGSVKSTVINDLGQTVDGLEELTSIAESGYATTISGSLIPGFIDEAGATEDVVALVNQTVQRYGLVAKLNDDILDEAALWTPGESATDNGKKQPIAIDLLGHNLCNINANNVFDVTAYTDVANIEMASYKVPTKLSKITQTNDLNSTEVTNFVQVDTDSTIVQINNIYSPALVTNVNNKYQYNKADTNKIYVFDETKVGVGEKFVGADGNLSTALKSTYAGVTKQLAGLGSAIAIQPYGYDALVIGSKSFDDAAGDVDGYDYPNPGEEFPKDNTNSFYIYPSTHPISVDVNDAAIEVPIVYDSTSGFIVHNPKSANVADYTFQKNALGNDIIPDWTTIDANTDYVPDAGEQTISDTDFSVERILEDDEDNSGTKYADLLESYGVERNVFLVEFDKPLVFNEVDASGDALDTEYVAEMYETADNNKVDSSKIIFSDSTYVDIYNDVSKSVAVFKVVTVDNVADKLYPSTLKAYVARKDQFLDGTASRQKSILDMLTGSSLRDSLTNLELIQFSYIVDGFKSYIEPSIKIQLKTIAQERILCRAILNNPSIEDFQKSKNPYFRASLDGEFSPKYIPTGGNLQLPYTNSFSYPSTDGFYAYFYGPNLIINDGGRELSMPPAAVVSNNFARKYQGGKVYEILAGSGAGSISGTGIAGVEYTFQEKNDGTGDRDYLDPFGYNVIVRKRNTGIQIYGNRTAQNTIETPMSSIHTSELVMYIQEQISQLLEDYVFKFNTAQNRLVIETQANQICSVPFNDGALAGYENIMNETNNTSDVINARIGILDTKLYANNGMEILVHRTKIDTLSNTASFEIL